MSDYINHPGSSFLDHYFQNKTNNIKKSLTESIKPTGEFDLEIEADKIYDRLQSLGFTVSRSIVVGIVTFFIEDKYFQTYLDMYYVTNGVEKYIINVMVKLPGGASELAFSFASKDIDEIFDRLNKKKIELNESMTQFKQLL